MIGIILLASLAQTLTDGEVTLLAGEMKFTEGPIEGPGGAIYFSDIPNNRIMKWEGKGLSVFREDSGGANGLRFDKEGNLYICEGGARRVTRTAPDGKVAVLADSYEGKKLNAPNDLILDGRGGVYFTDPCYGDRKQMEMEVEGVYYIPPGGGTLLRVADKTVRPNGIELREGRLYVADEGGDQVLVYDVKGDGTLGEGRAFCAAKGDGMKFDEKGNLYVATKRGVEVFDPEGTPIQTIAVPEWPANVAFGGKTLYITARKSLYAVPMKVGGRPD